MAASVWVLTLFFCPLFAIVNALDNGLARTPPMGWINWERFRCNLDCQKEPADCISERLFMETADHMAKDGFKDAGYNIVSIDDCWLEHTRDSHGNLLPNATRFPSGIKALSDYMHNRGLKLGIYQDYGTKTCAGYPGMIDHVDQDTKTFASWGVDYLKLDGCYCDPAKFDTGYPLVTKALKETGRPIIFSCEWPSYQMSHGMKSNFTAIAESCNLWRFYNDVQDAWQSILSIVDYYAVMQDTLVAAGGPGAWNDPDMLVVGDFSLSFDQSKAQFALWSIMAAPLMMSNDLRNLSPQAKEILLNREVIVINQDKLGISGKRVYQKNRIEIWCRPLHDGSVSAVVFSRRMDLPVFVDVPFELVGIKAVQASVRDLYEHRELGTFKNIFEVKVNPSGVVMVKITPGEIIKS